VAAAGFVVPYMAVYSPALMLQGGGILATIYVTFKAVVAISLWASGITGFLRTRMNWLERIWVVLAAALLVAAVPMTDEIGFAATAAFLVWHVTRSRRMQRLEKAA
jgi:TRAP-type uncharacterized transport system fused permease subunit